MPIYESDLHCILKGLHRSPRIISNPPLHGSSDLLAATDISCLVIPDGCVGLPTLAAIEQGIPVIAVRENKNRMKNNLKALPFSPGKLYMVDNYWEAVGVMSALRTGVAPESVRRPLLHTNVLGAKNPHTSPNNEQQQIDALCTKKKPHRITASSSGR